MPNPCRTGQGGIQSGASRKARGLKIKAAGALKGAPAAHFYCPAHLGRRYIRLLGRKEVAAALPRLTVNLIPITVGYAIQDLPVLLYFYPLILFFPHGH